MKLYAILMLVIIEMARIDSDRLALLPLGPLGTSRRGKFG
jgi:hypothetical protein